MSPETLVVALINNGAPWAAAILVAFVWGCRELRAGISGFRPEVRITLATDRPIPITWVTHTEAQP